MGRFYFMGRFDFGKAPRGPRCARQAKQRLASHYALFEELPGAHGPSRAASSMLREANERTTSWITRGAGAARTKR